MICVENAFGAPMPCRAGSSTVIQCNIIEITRYASIFARPYYKVLVLCRYLELSVEILLNSIASEPSLMIPGLSGIPTARQIKKHTALRKKHKIL